MDNNEGVVCINVDGKFLIRFEVSSHSQNVKYGWTWGDLPNATVFEDYNEVKNTPWKDYPSEPQVVHYIQAVEQRVVYLINPHNKSSKEDIG